MNRLRRLIVEAHRRSIGQVVGIYLVGSWLGYEVILGITEGVGLPDWVPAFAIVLFIIGLPIVLATAVVREGPPAPFRSVASDPTLLPEFDVAPAPRPRHLLTWRRSLLGGVLAFSALGATAGGYMGLRHAGVGPFGTLTAANLMREREPVLLTVFSSSDTALADVVTEALRVDLEQSTSVAVVSTQRVADALNRMQRPGARLDAALGTDLAEREGIAILLTGEVAEVGGNLLLTARLMEPLTGQVLASFRETARGEADVIAAVDRLSRSIRQRVGESLKSVRRSPPLEEVTTASVEALRLYSRALSLPTAEAVQLLEEAVRLDSTFAMAHRRLVGRYQNQSRHQRATEAAAAAYRHRDRLGERERLHVTATYHAVRGETKQAVPSYRAILDKWPDDARAAINMAIAYRDAGDPANAAKYYEIAIGLDTLRTTAYRASAIAMHWQLGDTARARLHLDEWKRLAPDQTHVLLGQDHQWALAIDDYDGAEAIARRRLEQATTPQQRAAAVVNLRNVAIFKGRVADVAAISRERRMLAMADGRPGVAIENMANETLFRLLHGLPADDLLREVKQLIARHWDSVAPLDRPYFAVGGVYGLTGDSAAVARLFDELRTLPPELAPALEDTQFQDALVSLARRQYAKALEQLRHIRAGCPYKCVSELLADAFHGLEQPDSAIFYYTEYIRHRNVNVPFRESLHRARVAERLAQLHDARGDTQDAIRYYSALTRQWDHADPVLQPRVQAARERLVRLQANRGR